MIYEEGKAAVWAALTRESLLRQFQDKNAVSIVCRLMIDGAPVYHTMRILRDASDGNECLVLGVLNVDESVRSGQRTKNYNAIAKTLANRYATIFLSTWRPTTMWSIPPATTTRSWKCRRRARISLPRPI